MKSRRITPEGSSATGSPVDRGRSSSHAPRHCSSDISRRRRVSARTAGGGQGGTHAGPGGAGCAGRGRSAVCLAEGGSRVHLIAPVPLHVEQARAAAGRRPAAALASAEVGDARALRLPDASADAVLLFGPLYHLRKRADGPPSTG